MKTPDKHQILGFLALLLVSATSIVKGQALDVTIRDLNTYENLTDPGLIDDHPLKGVLVKVTAIVLSHPLNSGVASYTAATNSIGRIHFFVVDTNALDLGMDGQYMQVVDAMNMPLVEALTRGDVITIEGRLTYFAAGTGFTVQLTTTTVSHLGSVFEDAPFTKFQPLLHPTVVPIEEINQKLSDGTFTRRLDNYTKYINRYIRIENQPVLNRLVANTGRPWMYVGNENAILPTTDFSLRFRNDRSASGYRVGFNWIRSSEGPYSPPEPGVIVNLSGFLLMNGFNVDNTGANTYKIAPWDDGVVWVPGSVSGEFTRTTPEGWPNDLEIVPQSIIELDSGLVARYPFNGVAESVVNPSIGGTNNGGNFGVDRFRIYPGSLYLNGQENDHVSTAEPMVDPQTFTLATWFKVSEGGGGNFISFTSSPSEISFQWDRLLGIDSQGKVRANVYSGGEIWLTSAESYNNNEWKHAVATLGSDGFKLYVNGVEVASTQTVTSAEPRNGYWRIGGLVYNGSTALSGGLDDIRIYNRALSSAEVAALFELESEIPPNAPNEIDDIDGNRYNTVRIGDQVWMAENLRTTRFRDGTAIPNLTEAAAWDGIASAGWVNYNNDPTLDTTHGKLYNIHAMADNRLICPTGWHVPTDAEWTALANFLGPDAGFKMKSTTGWAYGGDGSNVSGFDALPSGGRYPLPTGVFGYLNIASGFWSSSTNDVDQFFHRSLSSDSSLGRFPHGLKYGFSIRCLQGEGQSNLLSSVTTGVVSDITISGATVAAEVVSDGGSAVTARGIVWSTSQYPTVASNDGIITDGSGTGSLTSNLTGLSADTLYYVRAYATNGAGTSYGTQVIFRPALQASTLVSDIDGNVYPTVQIGTQVWMAENLRTTRYQDGSTIPNVTDVNLWSGYSFGLTTGAWAFYNNDTAYLNSDGRLYNAYVASDSRNACPVGWRVPSRGDWMILKNRLGENDARKLKSQSGWNSSGNGTNDYGFSARPSGGLVSTGEIAGTYRYFGEYGAWWSSSGTESSSFYVDMYWGFDFVRELETGKWNGFSIRCVADHVDLKASSDTWTLPVRATTSAGLSSTTNLGVSQSASDGLDSLDVPAPPTPPGTHIQLYTDRPEWNSPLGRRVGSDIKASVDLSAVPTSWTVYLSSSDVASGEMVLDRPAGLNWPIVVLNGSNRWLSRSGDMVIPFSFTAGGTQSFHVHVGDTTAPGLQAGDWFEGPAILDASQTHPLSWLSGDGNHLESVELSVSHDDGVNWNSLHTSVGSSFDWTPSPSIVFNESTRFRLTATDRAGNSTTISTQTPVSVMAPRQAVGFPQGWSLRGSAFAPTDESASVLDQAFRFKWTGTDYQRVNHVQTGGAMWIGAAEAGTDTLVGTVAGQGQVLQLPAGWNMVTAPLLRTVYADSVRVTHGAHGRTLTLAQAADSMWVTMPLSYFNGAYAQSGNFQPFAGYWMGVLAPSVSVDFPIHAYSTTVTKESTSSEPMVRLTLTDQGSEQVLSIRQGASVPAPPAAPNGERVGLKGQPSLLGDLYLVAGTNPDAESAWPLVIGGTSRDVTLSWTDQDFAGMTAVLDLPDRRYDLTRMNTVTLRTNESAQIVVGPISTSTEPGFETPLRTELMAAYPNPFNPSTQIRFTLDAGRQTRLAVYDMLGREVAVLLNGSLSAGTHQATFYASGLASGVYIYRLETGGEVYTRRMTLVK